jgi:hypothetical protein
MGLFLRRGFRKDICVCACVSVKSRLFYENCFLLLFLDELLLVLGIPYSILYQLISSQMICFFIRKFLYMEGFYYLHHGSFLLQSLQKEFI